MPTPNGLIIRSSCLLLVISCAEMVHGQTSLAGARSALDDVRTIQTQLIDRLAELDRSHRRAASMVDLLAGLESLGQLQAVVTTTAQGLLTRTFGKTMQDLAESDRQMIEQLAVDQQAIQQRWTDWQARLNQAVTGQDTPEALRSFQKAAVDSPVSTLMNRAAGQVQQNHLSQAAETAREAQDELARLQLALLAGTQTAEQLAERHLRLLKELADRQRQIRSPLGNDGLNRTESRRLLRQQVDLAREVRVLLFPEAAVTPGARDFLQTAHEAMNQAIQHLQRQRLSETRAAVDKAITSLEDAIKRAEAEAEKEIELPMPSGPRNQKRPDKLGGMPAMPGDSGAGIDVSALAQLTGDIALVVKIRRRQILLHRESIGELPVSEAMGRLAAGRQRALAALLPQLARRAEAYDPGLTPILEGARHAMVEATGRLENADRRGAAPFQKVAIERLTEAEVRMREFYARLLEALERFSAPSVEGAPHGAEGEEEKAKMTALLTMLREIVRVGLIMKELDVEIARAEAWSAGDTTPDEQAVKNSAAHHRELSKTGLDIVKQLSVLPGEVVMSLPEAVLEAAQFLEGAADSLDEPDFVETRDRQNTAMDFLENAWQTIAHSMATLTSGQDADDSEKNTEPGDSSESRSGGETAAAVTDSAGGDKKPWYWDLPPQARDAVMQSLSESLPPRYAPAIERYYERLSRSRSSEQ